MNEGTNANFCWFDDASCLVLTEKDEGIWSKCKARFGAFQS